MEKDNILLDEQIILNRINELALELYRIYGDKEVTFICTLKGSVFFTCDLLKKYPGNAKVEFLRISSYVGGESTGKVDLRIPISNEIIKDKDVIIVEDIIDTGYSLKYLYEYLESMNPKSLISCVLLDKKEKRLVNINPTYRGFVIDDLFVVGYGLDYNDKYRNLPYIKVLKK